MNYKQHTACRVCGSTKLTEYLDLGMMPLSNNLCKSPQENPDRYPLKVLFCEHCSLSQLSIVVDPAVLFEHYVYRSGISQGYKDHCRQMAQDLRVWGINSQSQHTDIAGNDGTLVKAFTKELGNGKEKWIVDPAENFEDENENAGIVYFPNFWSKEFGQDIHDSQDLITATNVFAHVDDVRDFLEGAKIALKKTGILVLEFPYLIDFIEKCEFDTVYFEHVSYFSITPLVKLANELGLTVLDVTHHEIHGGSVRVIIGKVGEPNKSVNTYLTNESELGFSEFKTYLCWAKDVYKTVCHFRNELFGLKGKGARIGAFAASAKGNTLLNAAGIDHHTIEYIIDETPEKIGKFSPGTGIEIVPLNFPTRWPDYMVILSWNFADEIINKCRRTGYTGKFILPLTFEII